MQNIIGYFVDLQILSTIVDLPNLLPSTPLIFSLIHNVQIGNVLGKFHHFNGCHRNPLRPMSSNVTELSRGKNFCVDFFVLDFHHNQRQIFSQQVHFLPRFGISKRTTFSYFFTTILTIYTEVGEQQSICEAKNAKLL